MKLSCTRECELAIERNQNALKKFELKTTQHSCRFKGSPHAHQQPARLEHTTHIVCAHA